MEKNEIKVTAIFEADPLYYYSDYQMRLIFSKEFRKKISSQDENTVCGCCHHKIEKITGLRCCHIKNVNFLPTYLNTYGEEFDMAIVHCGVR